MDVAETSAQKWVRNLQKDTYVFWHGTNELDQAVALSYVPPIIAYGLEEEWIVFWLDTVNPFRATSEQYITFEDACADFERRCAEKGLMVSW